MQSTGKKGLSSKFGAVYTELVGVYIYSNVLLAGIMVDAAQMSFLSRGMAT